MEKNLSSINLELASYVNSAFVEVSMPAVSKIVLAFSTSSTPLENLLSRSASDTSSVTTNTAVCMAAIPVTSSGSVSNALKILMMSGSAIPLWVKRVALVGLSPSKETQYALYRYVTGSCVFNIMLSRG